MALIPEGILTQWQIDAINDSAESLPAEGVPLNPHIPKDYILRLGAASGALSSALEDAVTKPAVNCPIMVIPDEE